MDVQAIAAQVADAIKETPEKAQELISNPAATVEGITGAAADFDMTELFQAVMEKLSGLGVDLSSLDLSKADLSAIDVSKLDVGKLADAAKGLGVDISKLDVGGMLKSSVGGFLGGLFGKK